MKNFLIGWATVIFTWQSHSKHPYFSLYNFSVLKTRWKIFQEGDLYKFNWSHDISEVASEKRQWCVQAWCGQKRMPFIYKYTDYIGCMAIFAAIKARLGFLSQEVHLIEVLCGSNVRHSCTTQRHTVWSQLVCTRRRMYVQLSIKKLINIPSHKVLMHAVHSSTKHLVLNPSEFHYYDCM